MPGADTVELRIEHVGVRGDGIAQWRGEPVFVPFTAPGDFVRAVLGTKRGEGRVGELRELIAIGARADPPCAHFGACGGCALQHLDDAAYVAAKRQWLERAALAQQGLKPEAIAPLTRDLPPRIRRRARFQLARPPRRLSCAREPSHRRAARMPRAASDARRPAAGVAQSVGQHRRDRGERDSGRQWHRCAARSAARARSGAARGDGARRRGDGSRAAFVAARQSHHPGGGASQAAREPLGRSGRAARGCFPAAEHGG